MASGRSPGKGGVVFTSAGSGRSHTKPGAVLIGNEITAPLPPLAAPSSPAELIGWDSSLSVTGIGTASRLKGRSSTLVPAAGQHFLLADLKFATGAEAQLTQAADVDGMTTPGGGVNRGDDTGEGLMLTTTIGLTDDVTVTVDAAGGPTPVDLSQLQGSPGQLPLLVSVPTDDRSVTLTWKDGQVAGAVDLATGQVTTATPALFARGSNLVATQGTPAEYTQTLGNEQVQDDPAFLSYFDQDGTPIAPSPAQAELVVFVSEGNAEDRPAPPWRCPARRRSPPRTGRWPGARTRTS